MNYLVNACNSHPRGAREKEDEGLPD